MRKITGTRISGVGSRGLDAGSNSGVTGSRPEIRQNPAQSDSLINSYGSGGPRRSLRSVEPRRASHNNRRL